MNSRTFAAMAIVALALGACVTATHQENAARRSTWPTDAFGPVASAQPGVGWPSVDGDILRGTSPAELTAARAAISKPLTDALTRP